VWWNTTIVAKNNRLDIRSPADEFRFILPQLYAEHQEAATELHELAQTEPITVSPDPFERR
jgi:hypothetical protein